MQVHAPLSENLHCPTCKVVTPTQQEYRLHYKSDFHRYNLKRKNVKLPPASLQQFLQKKQQIISQQSISLKCKECGKHFGSQNTFNQHVTTKKHDPNKTVILQKQTPRQTSLSVKDPLFCLFCLLKSPDLSSALHHLEISHGFFIPSFEFCINPSGLLLYLQEKIEVGHLCILCENRKAKDFTSGQAVRKHMVDKGHFFVNTSQGFEEYQNFYDFSKLFLEKIQEQKNRKGVAPAGIEYEEVKVFESDKLTKRENQQIKDSQNNEDWEDQDEDEDEDDQDWEEIDDQEGEHAQTIQEQKQQQSNEKRVKPKVKKYYLMRPTLTPNEQLLLPNGKILGNRKYRFLYKQTYRENYQPYKNLKQLEQGQYPSTNGQSSALMNTRQMTMFEMKKMERMVRRSQKLRKKEFLKVGMANNVQLHYRCQNSL